MKKYSYGIESGVRVSLKEKGKKKGKEKGKEKGKGKRKEKGKGWCGILSVTNAARRDKNRQGKHNSCGNQQKS